jgi:hypothetical protein
MVVLGLWLVKKIGLGLLIERKKKNRNKGLK